MDLKIKIGDEFVDLYPNTKIKYIYNSPAFSDSLIMGDISQMVNLPPTAKNKSIFSHLHRPESYASLNQTYSCEVHPAGFPLIRGKFKLKKATSKGFRGNIVGGVSEFKEDIGEGKLTDIDFGSDIVLGGSDAAARAYLVSAAKSSYPTYNFVAFPVKNALFYGEEEDRWEANGFLLTDNEAAQGIVNVFYSDKFEDLSTGADNYGGYVWVVKSYCPYLYTKFIIDKLFAEHSFNLDGDWYNDSEISTLVLHHLNSTNESLIPTSAPLSVAPSGMVPDMTIKDFLMAHKQMFNLGFFYSYTNRTFFIEPLKSLLSSTVVDWTEKAEKINEIVYEESKSGHKMEFQFDDEDEIASDYIQELGAYTVKSAVNHIVLLPSAGNSIGDVRYVRLECAYYIWAANDSGTLEWQKFSYPYHSLTVGEGENSINPELGPIPSAIIDQYTWDQDLADWRWAQKKLPIVHQLGNSRLVNGLMGNPFAGRLLFYRGIKRDSYGYYYPLGSADAKDYNGNSTGDYTLQWDGDKGLYKIWHEDWVEFISNSKKTSWSLKLNINDLVNLDMRKRIRIESTLYLIRKLTVEFPFKGMAKAELMKITAGIEDESSSSGSAGDFTNTSPNDDFNNDFYK